MFVNLYNFNKIISRIGGKSITFCPFSPQEENYEPLNVPIEKMTSYNQEFTAKQAQPEFRRMEPRGTVQIPDVKFDGHTTNKDHFKQWIAQPTMHFQELPSFTGSENINMTTQIHVARLYEILNKMLTSA